MKFLHTADWQLGMKAVHVGAAGARVREERLVAAQRVVSAAQSQGAEFLLVAGDTFEDNAVDRLLVQKTADLLAAFPGPVYILPGNHDPLVPGSVWEHPAWCRTNLHVLREPTPLTIPGGTLIPAPLLEKYSTRNPVAEIDARTLNLSTTEPVIGMAHGTLNQIAANDDNFPIPNNAAQTAGLDYLALGHWHSHLEIKGSDGIARLAYSGTHEPTKFGERQSGNALLVEISERNAIPRITPLRTGGLTWLQWAEVFQQTGDAARLRQRIEQVESPASTLLEVRLTGLMNPREQAELQHIRELLAARFLYARLDDTPLVPTPEDDSWLVDLPAGVLQETARRLQASTDPAASQALLEMYRLLH